MSRPPTAKRVPIKDMYWFAHGGVESGSDKCFNQKEGDEAAGLDCDSVSPTFRTWADKKGPPDDSKDSCSSSGPSSLELREKHFAAEERRKQLWEAEQERNDAVMKKHLEREAALEARRNAQRSNISFAFGSSVPRNVDSLAVVDSDRQSKQPNASGLLPKEENYGSLHYRRSVSPLNSQGQVSEVDRSSTLPYSSQSNLICERKAFSPPSSLVGSGALIGEDLMTKSMTAAVPATRGRRKNDLMPAVPYERIPAPKASSSSSTRKRSVSMTRLDQLAQPRKHYVEASKAGSANSSVHKDMLKSPTRPLSSASEQSGSSGRPGTAAAKRVRSTPRKPRPVSIAGSVPDHKMDFKVSPIKKTPLATKKPQAEAKKAALPTNKPPKSAEKPSSSATRAAATPKPKAVTSTPKQPKQPPQPKATSSPKTPPVKKSVTNKKKADILVTSQAAAASVAATPPTEAPTPTEPVPSEVSDAEHAANAKRITSEEEAKAALAEKRRLAREQAEKEAELERLRQEELRRQEEESLRLEEEEQKRLEEEHLRLIEEHKKLEEEKLKKAIEENERKEEEERLKREEELRFKAEQEKKMQEEAEKQRIELEEKLRKEEEERAERKKRLEKIMSRTRGKTTGSSPSGSISGSDQLDSSDNAADNHSSGANSLESNEPEVIVSGPDSLEAAQKSEVISDGASIEANPTYEVSSDNESLHDIVMPKSETASEDNSLVMLQDADDFKTSVIDTLIESSVDDDPIPEAAQSAGGERSPAVALEQAAENASLTEDKVFADQDAEDSLTEKAELVEEIVSKPEVAQLESMTPALQAHPLEESMYDVNEVDADAELLLAKSSVSMLDAADMDQHSSHFSTSSDIKLPDPIYENTSDEGSVSSERQLDSSSFAFREEDHRQESHMVDEVFGEKVDHAEEGQYNPFEQQDTRYQSMAAYESQFDVGGLQESIYAYETSDARLPDVLEQPREIGEENVYSSVSSTSSLVDVNATSSLVDVNATSSLADGNDTSNLNSEAQNKEVEGGQLSNPFGDIPFNDSAVDSLSAKAQSEDNPLLAENAGTKDQIHIQPQSSSQLVAEDESINVTIVKADGSNECIGIISSVENDQISSDLTLQQNIRNEQFKSNFECSSVTESEDSSLDSNLSQVMTGDANDVKDLVELSNESSKPNGLSNGQGANPFSEPSLNGSSESKLNGEHFYHETETLQNGHKLESSNMHEFSDLVQLVDGKHISSVDHPTSNIFDSVDAVSFGKVSPDPFLAKGGSNQISGNPFLLQEEQKQVIMTPDFFN